VQTNQAVLKLLLTRSHVDADLKDKYRRTPPLWLVQNGHEAIVELLVVQAVDMDSKSIYGGTPLRRAVRIGH
jgi:ankyrin repeat protein